MNKIIIFPWRCIIKLLKLGLCFVDSVKHVPGFIEKAEELKSKGVAEILLISGTSLLFCFFVFVFFPFFSFHFFNFFGLNGIIKSQINVILFV